VGSIAGASGAGAGEILISEATYDACGWDLDDLEHRDLELKGRSEPSAVRVMRIVSWQINGLWSC
jgi:class 3 adenylate cyclase